MKCLKLFFLILFTTIISCSEREKKCNYIIDYHPFIIRAEIAYEKGNYNEAYAELSNAFSSCSPRNTIPYYEIDKMSKITAHLGLYQESVEMIKLQISEGFTLNKYKDDTLFKKVFESKYGLQLLKQYDSLRSGYLSSIDTSIVNKLIDMSACDQLFRKNSLYQENKQKQRILDSLNEIQLVEIFETHGYPSEHLRRYAYPEMIRIDVMLLHTEDSIRKNYFIPKLKEFVILGQCDPQVYAEIFDQFLLYSGLPQQYGTYTRQDGSLSNSISLKEVDSMRLSIGLPTLKEKELLHQLKIVNYPDTYGRFFQN